MDILDKLSPPASNEDAIAKAATWTEVTLVMMLVMILIMTKEQRTPLALPTSYALSLILFFVILVVQRLRVDIKAAMLSGDAAFSAGRFYDQGRMSSLYTVASFLMGWVFYGLMGTHLDLIVMSLIGVPTLLSVYYVRSPAPPMPSPLAQKQSAAYNAIPSMRFAPLCSIIQKCSDGLGRVS